MTLGCSVKEAGRPPASSFLWSVSQSVKRMMMMMMIMMIMMIMMVMSMMIMTMMIRKIRNRKEKYTCYMV